jgi:hypothetical protein
MAKTTSHVDWEELAWDHGFLGHVHTMLYTWYIEHRMTQEEIGRKLNIAASTVGKKLRLLNIEISPPRNPACGRGARI